MRKVVIGILSSLALAAGLLWPNVEFSPIAWSWFRNDSTWTEVCIHQEGVTILTIEDTGHPSFRAYIKSFARDRARFRQEYGATPAFESLSPLPVALFASQCTRWSGMFVVLFAAYPVFAFIRGPLRRWRRRRQGRCVKCGYSLTGNVTGVCPECGEAV